MRERKSSRTTQGFWLEDWECGLAIYIDMRENKLSRLEMVADQKLILDTSSLKSLLDNQTRMSGTQI